MRKKVTARQFEVEKQRFQHNSAKQIRPVAAASYISCQKLKGFAVTINWRAVKALPTNRF